MNQQQITVPYVPEWLGNEAQRARDEQIKLLVQQFEEEVGE